MKYQRITGGDNKNKQFQGLQAVEKEGAGDNCQRGYFVIGIFSAEPY